MDKFIVQHIALGKNLNKAAKQLEQLLNEAVEHNMSIEFVQNIDNRGYMVLLRAREEQPDRPDFSTVLREALERLGTRAERVDSGEEPDGAHEFSGTPADFPERVNKVMAEWMQSPDRYVPNSPMATQMLAAVLKRVYAQESGDVLAGDRDTVLGCLERHKKHCQAKAICTFIDVLTVLSSGMTELIKDRLQ